MQAEHDAPRQALDWLIKTHPQAYQEVLRAWFTSVTTEDITVREQAIDAYLHARVRCGRMIMQERRGGDRWAMTEW
jgi:hypothetical protein